MKSQEFFRRLGKGGYAPVYFFPGAETFLKKRAVTEITKVIPEGQRAFNVDVCYGGESELSDVLTTARTLPFLAARRVVVLRNVEKVKLAGPREEMLSSYLDDPPPETVLVLATEDPAASRSLGKKFGGRWTEVDFRPLREQAFKTALREAAAGRGLTLESGAVEALTEAVGSDLGRAHQEMEKLALAGGGGKAVDVETVHRLVCGYSYQTMFDLVEAIAARDVTRALTLTEKVFETGTELPGLTGMLAKRFRVLWFLAPGDGAGGQPVPSAFRVQKWQLSGLKRQAARFTRGQVESLLGELLELDRLTKSSPVPARLLLERLVLSLDGRPSRTGWQVQR